MQKFDIKALLVLFLINLNQVEAGGYNPTSFPPGMPGMPGMPGAAINGNNKTGGNTPPAYLKTSAFDDIGKAPADTSTDQFNAPYFGDNDWSTLQLNGSSSTAASPTQDPFGFKNSDIAAGS